MNNKSKLFTIHHSPFTKNGFTFAEMMVVMMVISLITIATIPAVTRRTIVVSSVGKWKYASNRLDIYYGTSATQGVAIGATGLNSNETRLLLNTSGPTQSQIIFQESGTARAKLMANSDNNLVLGNATTLGTNDVALGYSTNFTDNSSADKSNYSVGIGYAKVLRGAHNSVAIGYNSTADTYDYDPNNDSGYLLSIGGQVSATESAAQGHSVAIGYDAIAAQYAVVVGCGEYSGYANAGGFASTALGCMVNINATPGGRSVAIGTAAQATGGESIAIGACDNSDGNYARAVPNYSIALGAHARVTGTSSGSVAIGTNSSGTGATVNNILNQIKLGSTHTVSIPGYLSVEKTSTLTGNVSMGGTLTVTGAGTLTGNVTVASPRTLTIQTLGSGGTTQLYLNGATSGVVSSSSDRRLKNLHGEFTGGLNEIKQLKVYNYTFKKDKTKTPLVGVMAQDLQKVFPNAVSKNKEGYFMIRKEDMFYALLNSIKQLDKMLSGLKIRIQLTQDKILALMKVDKMTTKKIKELEAMNKKYEARIAKLEKLRKG